MMFDTCLSAGGLLGCTEARGYVPHPTPITQFLTISVLNSFPITRYRESFSGFLPSSGYENDGVRSHTIKDNLMI
jgi:hypothetical protein